MKLFQVLIALFILTVSASVYAMGIYIQPFSPASSRMPAVEIKPAASFPAVQKKSAAERKVQELADMQRYSRLLAASS